eukprot:CAMPEP_0197823844 /NCGR_PEP_ID=MMETSP1437-20131217/1155_1 /TAXON_ID=49252 ORGANISM="Eucampia antarctica, Strain CCMP1452" /NCGR_SAMPLE_ID=MMETSP1437 /ASSEMBLY_ACC=CAM_ASM_001096 /LENGTH=509 /DNA_ID=CAMNT_0043423209 /DNA_START=56 /DNA_END=1585 /DNA_ORIENTATION=-
MHLGVVRVLGLVSIVDLCRLNSLSPLSSSSIAASAFMSVSRQKGKFVGSLKTEISMSVSSDDNDNGKADFKPPSPKLEIPDPLLSLTPGTWAFDTMSRRVHEDILTRTYEENKEEFESPAFATAKANFFALKSELENAADTPLTHLDETEAEDYQDWFKILEPYVQNKDTWLSAPWMVTEFYVYRRLLQALGYFSKGSNDKQDQITFQYDPFVKQKRAGLYTSPGSAEAVMSKVESLPELKDQEEACALAAAFALWGNKMDLSIWPADVSSASSVDVFTDILDNANDNLLHDDTDKLTQHCLSLLNKGGGRIDIIIDNAGFELVTDLALADYLIASGIAKVVNFQLKKHPTFVSDAMETDLLETVEFYANELSEQEYPASKRAGQRWQQYLAQNKWTCHENSFWVQPPPMWEMPQPLYQDLQQNCDLAFVKGDANYRRLLGDCDWDYSAPFEDIVGTYFPCPVCALRTLKAEIGCGMEIEQVQRAKSLDENWMVNGRFGVVHFGTGNKK